MPYNPSLGTTSQKPIGISSASPTDMRSYYYDVALFKWRPFQNTSEVLAYFPDQKNRAGHFPIFISTGSLISDGTFIGGTVKKYIFKDGTADSNLVLDEGGSASLSVNNVSADNTGNIATASYADDYFPDLTGDVKTNKAFRIGDTIVGLLNKIGEPVTYSKVVATDSQVDGVITRKKDTEYFRLNYTGPLDIRWFGCQNGGVFDNSPILNALFSNTNLSPHIYLPPGTFQCNSPLFANRVITLFGHDSPEYFSGPRSTLRFPAGVDGFKLLNYRAAGSHFKSLTFSGATATPYGSVIEYNPDTGLLMFSPSITIAGKATTTRGIYEFRDPTDPDTIVATATINTAPPTSVTGQDMRAWLQFYTKTGTFSIGETVTGSVSGATSKVIFTSKINNLIAVGQPTGTFVDADVITGSSSGAVGNVYQARNSASVSYGLMQVVALSNVTGEINSFTDEAKRGMLMNKQGNYATGFLAGRRFTMEDVSILSFGGEGLVVSSILDTNLSPDPTVGYNANCARIMRCSIQLNGGNAIRVKGADANALSISACTMVNNGGFALLDRSFLGIAVEYCHTSNNLAGEYNSGNSTSRKTTYFNCYAEGYLVMAPFQQHESAVDGSSMAIGGTRGTAVVRGITPTGVDIDAGVLRNQFINSASGQTTFKSNGGTSAFPLSIEHKGNLGTSNGLGISVIGPYTSSKTGPASTSAIPTSYEYGNMYWVPNSTGFSQKFGLRKARGNSNLTITVNDPGGTGDGVLTLAKIAGGTITSIAVVGQGYGYSINTTFSCNTPASGVAAQLKPVVQDGKIVSVVIVDGGLGYADNDMNYLLELTTIGNTLRPGTDRGLKLGDTTHAFTNIYTDRVTLTTPSLVTTPVAGTLEMQGDNLYFTTASGVRRQIQFVPLP